MLRKPLFAAMDFTGYGLDMPAVKNLVRAYTGDEYPCQDFVGIDSAGRPCVILHFADFDDDGNEIQNYETFYFSNLQTAEKAFMLLNEFDNLALAEILEKK